MGYTTDFIGHINIRPGLTSAEQQYLQAFSDSRRFARPSGPYEVPSNPAAERDASSIDVDTYNTLGDGAPSLWCHWVPCWEGCCLAHSGAEKFYDSTRWLSYLIDHFLRPGAQAQSSGLACFAGFTFDHVLNGIVAANRRDTRELYLIHVEDNDVTEEELVGPQPDVDSFGPLPYETELDRSARRRRRRTVRPA